MRVLFRTRMVSRVPSATIRKTVLLLTDSWLATWLMDLNLVVASIIRPRVSHQRGGKLPPDFAVRISVFSDCWRCGRERPPETTWDSARDLLAIYLICD